MGIKEVPTGLIGAALGGVKKDKAPRLTKKGKKGGGEAEEQAAEALMGGEDVDPLYALSVHAVSASAKEKAAKDALKTGEGSAAGKDKDRPRDAPPGKDKSPSATSLDDKVPSRTGHLAPPPFCASSLFASRLRAYALTCRRAVCAHCSCRMHAAAGCTGSKSCSLRMCVLCLGRHAVLACGGASSWCLRGDLMSERRPIVCLCGRLSPRARATGQQAARTAVE
jgi:hypothetical protein